VNTKENLIKLREENNMKFEDTTLTKIKYISFLQEQKKNNSDEQLFLRAKIQHPFRIAKDGTLEFYAQTIEEDPILEKEGFKEYIQINVYIPAENEVTVLKNLFKYNDQPIDQLAIEVKKTDKLPVEVLSTVSLNDKQKGILKENILNSIYKYHLLPGRFYDEKTDKIHVLLSQHNEDMEITDENSLNKAQVKPKKVFLDTYVTFDTYK